MSRSYKNNFIIGLGGAGGRSLAAFRRATVVRKDEYKSMTEAPTDKVRFEYLYIDSSTDQRDDKQQWTSFGKDVSLDRSDYISITDVGNTFDAARNSRQISPWLGDYTLIQNTREGATRQNLTGAEQMRRFGRALFALKAAEINSNLNAKIGKLAPRDPNDNITFHIFATLGGGTGSGGLIDLVTLICSLCKDRAKCMIFLYLYVGGEGMPSDCNVGYFYENEYATLRDLNALMTGHYHPHMAASVPNDASACDVFLNVNDIPVGQVYICSDMAPVSIGNGSLADQASFMAETCFDIIYSHHTGLGSNLQKAFSGEDRLTSYPAEDGERSYRFAVLGTKRWCVPTERIAEALQLQFQHIVLKGWLEGTTDGKSAEMRFGKSEESAKHPPILNLDEKMQGQNFETRNRAERYLEEKVRAIADRFTQESQTAYDAGKLERLTTATCDILKQIAADSENEDALGVYNDDIGNDVENIVRDLNAALARKRQWRSSGKAWGLKDASECIRKFSDFLEKRLGEPVPAIETNKLGNMGKREEQWRKVAFLTHLFTDKETSLLIMHQREAIGLVERAVTKTLREKAYRRFYERLDKELANMRTALGDCVRSLEHACEHAKAMCATVFSGLTQNSTGADVNSAARFDFDTENLRKVMEYLDKNDSAHYVAPRMSALEKTCWDKIWSPGGATEYYATDPDAINRIPDLLARLRSEDCAWILSREMVEEITRKEAEYKDLYHDSLYDRLNQSWKGKDEYARRQEVISFIDTLCTSAAISPVDPWICDQNTAPIKALALGLPRNDSTGLKDFIRDTIQNNIGNKVSSASQFSTYELDSKRDLRIIYCQYWMPARFTNVVSLSLQKRFHDTLANKNAEERRRKLYLCNMDDAGIDESLEPDKRPSLMKTLASDREFAMRVELLCLLKTSPGGKYPVAVKEQPTGADRKAFHVARAVNLPETEVPAYEEFSWTELRHPSNMATMLVDRVLRDRLATMDAAGRAAFREAYDRRIAEASDAKGPLAAEVKGMQNFKDFFLKVFNDIPYVPRKND